MIPATKNKNSAECSNADDLFGAYILSCHLVSRMKNTIRMCTIDNGVVAQRAYPYNLCSHQ